MKVKYGMIHGRFQPFHKGHLEYAKKALSKCKTLFIGISRPEPELSGPPDPLNPNRDLPEKNPFTYFERMMMIKKALAEEGVDLTRIHVVPLPVPENFPNRWKAYCPKDAIHYCTLISEWDKKKIEICKEVGWKTEILDVEERRRISGSEVRRRMIDDGNWEELVPKTVAEYIKEINGIERIKKLSIGGRKCQS